MNNNPIVSIIVPCYNGQNHIGRLIKSVLQQTYKNIDFIIVDDGSTDCTKEIVEEYRQKANSLYSYNYIFKENGGQASAINTGLNYVKGEFLMWVDADDELTSDNVEKKINFFESHSDYSFVQSGAISILEGTEEIIRTYIPKEKSTYEYFMALIQEKSIFFPPGIFMVRTSALQAVLPEFKIIESELGQNWQLLLPLAYEYKCGCIQEILFKYYVRKDSHSRAKKTYEDWMIFFNKSEQLLLNIINSMGLEKVDIISAIYDKYARLKLHADFKHGRQKECREHFKEIRIKKMTDYMICSVMSLKFLYNIASRKYKSML